MRMAKYPKMWKTENNVLSRTFVFPDFSKAIMFINNIAALADELNHHPDLELFSYNKVNVKLTTHDAGNTITKKDIGLAKKIEQVAYPRA